MANDITIFMRSAVNERTPRMFRIKQLSDGICLATDTSILEPPRSKNHLAITFINSVRGFCIPGADYAAERLQTL
jgi:hypothetical protein